MGQQDERTTLQDTPQQQAAAAVAKQQAARSADVVPLADLLTVQKQLEDMRHTAKQATQEAAAMLKDFEGHDQKVQSLEDAITGLRADNARLESVADQQQRILNGLQATIELQAGRLGDAQDVIVQLSEELKKGGAS